MWKGFPSCWKKEIVNFKLCLHNPGAFPISFSILNGALAVYLDSKCVNLFGMLEIAVWL